MCDLVSGIMSLTLSLNLLADLTDGRKYVTSLFLHSFRILLFYRYIQWKVEKATGERLPIGRLAATLGRIRLGGLITGSDGGRKIKFKLEQMGKNERMLVKALNLERFIPNKV